MAGHQTIEEAVGEARRVGVEHVQVVSFRDLGDERAGGSEVYLDHMLSRWADAGLRVSSRTVAGSLNSGSYARNGYRVERVGGYGFGMPRLTFDGVRGRFDAADALVEVWNGWPAWSPLWWRHKPRLAVVHHLHDVLWKTTYPAPVAAVGRFAEHHIAPMVYRSTPVVTLSSSSAAQLRAVGLQPVSIVEPGVARSFSPDMSVPRAPRMLSVGRLTAAKRVDVVIAACAALAATHPEIGLDVVGDGPEAARLRALTASLGLAQRVTFHGSVDPDTLVRLYRQARVLVSASSSEGWGMTITEAGACGTPAVVSDIVGHRDAVGRGAGVLVPDDGHFVDRFAGAVAGLLDDGARWETAARAACTRAETMCWDSQATRLLGHVIDAARHH